MQNPFNIISKLLWKHLARPEAYARHIGVKIGRNCFIDTRHWSSEPYLISIGDNVQVTKDVYFHTHGGCHAARHTHPDFDVFGKITIGDWAYIGSGSHLMPGVTVGRGALIAAGSIVTKSVPDGEVWGGNPARRICTVEEFVERNASYNLRTKGLSAQAKRAVLLSLDDNRFIRK